MALVEVQNALDRDIDPQNPENARNQAKKNQCSWTDLIKIWDACDLKMTPILHF